MNNFEYMQRAVIGQYFPGNSPLHRSDPRARILMYTLILLSVVLSPSLIGILIGLGFVLIGLALSQIPFRYAWRSLLVPIPFLLVLAAIQLFITPPGETEILWQAGFLRIAQSGVTAAVRLLLRFVALILGLSLASFTLSPSDLIHGLRTLLRPMRRLGIRTQDWILAIQETLRFVPFLALSAERIAKAQAARGAEWGTGKGNLIQRAKEIIPLIVPLFLTSLRRADNLAIAMDARSYGVTPNPTSMIELRWRLADTLGLVVTLAGSAWIFLA